MSISIIDNRSGLKTTFGPEPRRRRRRRRGDGYRAPISRVWTAIGADMCIKYGWSVRRAAAVFCSNPSYIGRAKSLSATDRARLARGELRIAELWKDYRRRLDERRAQRLAAEREAKVRAEREAQTRAIDGLLASVGIDRIVDRIINAFGPEPLLEELDVCLRRSGRDLGQLVVTVSGPDRVLHALDSITAPNGGNGAAA